MRVIINCFAASVLCCGIGHAAEDVATTTLVFGSTIDKKCEAPPSLYTLESAQLAAWAASFGVKTVVGLATGLLEKASEAGTVTRSAVAPALLYDWVQAETTQADADVRVWRPSRACLRFWYGQQRRDEVPAQETMDYGGGLDGLDDKWRQLGLDGQPFIYGEVLISTRVADNSSYLQPVVLFARRLPEARGFLRKATRLMLAVDLKALGADKPFASHSIEFPDVNERGVLVRGLATAGLSSNWFGLPAPPKEAPAGKQTKAGPYAALVTLTSSSDSTLFGKSVTAAFKAEKDNLTTALIPKSDADSAAAAQKLTTDAFDALSLVADAQYALDKETEDAKKDKLRVALRKTQYLADIKLLAAGLPARYNVSGP